MLHLRLCAVAALLTAMAIARLPAQGETAPFPRGGEYAGAERCIECHERQHGKLLAAVHRVVLDPALPGCETCHGPGKAHADSADNDLDQITLPPLLSATGQRAFCGRCHGDQIERHGGDMNGLLVAGQSCTDCHEVHGAPRDKHPGVAFAARAEADAHAETVGSAACVGCHPLRDEALARGPHRALTSGARDDGCETCHGSGSLHVDDRGLARLITRPDRATDGVATCRSCHAEVDGVDFHWRGRHKPYLSAGVTCATCHRVHVPADPVADAVAAPDARPAADAAVADAVTNRVCVSCHVPALCTMPGSLHSTLGGLDVSLAAGCGACHQGALEHARAGGRGHPDLRLGARSPRQQSETCLQCHRGDAALQQVRHGSHFRQGVGCVDCHGPLHGAAPSQVAATAEQSCARCHGDVAAEFALPNHHPVPEGRMRCSSCHDVHGSRSRLRDRDLGERKCEECHPRYRGPFVYEHQAGRREGCVVCHTPHGAVNQRLLRQATTQQNCLSCHGDFPSFHDQTQGAVFTNCIRCHTQVHGSNHSRYLLR